MTIAADLAEATRAIDDGDWRRALERMLAVWRSVPDAVLADAIERVGSRAGRAVPVPAGSTDDERAAAWFAAAERDDPVMRHALLATVTDTRDLAKQVERIAALARIRDPRIANKLADMATKPFATPGESVASVWRPLFALLRACGDPRVRSRIDRLDWSRSGMRPARREAVTRSLVVLRRQLAELFPDPQPALSDDDRAAVLAIRTRAELPDPSEDSHAATEAGLLAAVYADPADDGPREIYADWLQERGDPRGEFIALQLAQSSEREPRAHRAHEILVQHRERWLGTLAPLITRVKFERGFLAACDVVLRHTIAADRRIVPADPCWSTVREIIGAFPATDAYPMPMLTSAVELDAHAFENLAKLTTPPPLERLGWRSHTSDWRDGKYTDDTRAAIEAFAGVAPRLPLLRRLELRGAGSWISNRMRPDQLGWSWQITTIRELLVTAHLDQLGAWFAVVIASSLDRFTLTDDVAGHGAGWAATLSRNERGAFTDLAITGSNRRHTFPADLLTIAAALEDLPRGQLTTLRMGAPASDVWTLRDRRRMARALAHHPLLTEPDITGYVKPGT